MGLFPASSVEKAFPQNGRRDVHPVIDRNNLKNREILPWEANLLGESYHKIENKETYS
jgi:hypothetical protein